MNGRLDHSADLYSFIASLRSTCHDKFQQCLLHEFKRIFGRLGGHKMMPGQKEVPTVKDFMLSSGFFDDFLFDGYQRNYIDTWNANITKSAIVEFPIDILLQEERHCPIIRRIQPRLTKSPSQVYFERCKPWSKLVDDGGDGTEYNRDTAKRIVKHLATIYTSNYNFPDDKKKSFMYLVFDIGSNFIQMHYVPYKWWHVAFSCAFNDAIYEQCMADAKKRYWTITDFGEFWERVGEVCMTDMEILHFQLQWNWERE